MQIPSPYGREPEDAGVCDSDRSSLLCYVNAKCCFQPELRMPMLLYTKPHFSSRKGFKLVAIHMERVAINPCDILVAAGEPGLCVEPEGLSSIHLDSSGPR